jgi:ABC-type sugar transport system ATPase subunit
MAQVRLRDVVKRYGRLDVVSNLSLTIRMRGVRNWVAPGGGIRRIGVIPLKR